MTFKFKGSQAYLGKLHFRHDEGFRHFFLVCFCNVCFERVLHNQWELFLAFYPTTHGFAKRDHVSEVEGCFDTQNFPRMGREA